MKTRIISDLHLGHSASRLKSPEMLRPILQGIDHLVLAGDVWQQRFEGEKKARAERLYHQLLDLCAETELEVSVLRGNHDPHGGAGVKWLLGGRLLVTHGDAVYQDATPWSREMSCYRAEVSEIIARYQSQSHLAEACAERAREIALTLRVTPLPKLPPPFNFFATALWPPSRTCEMIRVWRGMGSEGLVFLKKSGQGAEVLVCGHFHQAGIWEDQRGLFINTGSFMRGSCAWAVDCDDQLLSATKIVQNEGVFALGEVQGSWRLS